MPGSVQSPSPVGVFPYSLSTKFTSSRQYETRVAEYHDGTTERASLVGASRRTWKMSKRLTPADAATLRAWFDGHQADAFYFYDLRETSPINTWDPSGAATAGRYIVRLNSDWHETIGWPRMDVDVELIEILSANEEIASAVLSLTHERPAGGDIVPIASMNINSGAFSSLYLFDGGTDWVKRTDTHSLSLSTISGTFISLAFSHTLLLQGAPATWLVYDAHLSVTYSSGATAVLRPVFATYYPGGFGGAGGEDSISDRANAYDDDTATFATFSTGHTHPLADPTRLVLTW